MDKYKLKIKKLKYYYYYNVYYSNKFNEVIDKDKSKYQIKHQITKIKHYKR